MTEKNNHLLSEMKRIQVEATFEVEDDINTLGKSLLRINDIASAAIAEAEKVVDFDQVDRDDAIATLNAEKMILSPKANMEIQTVMEKFALIVYDIPATPEGTQARMEFLSKAKFLGAVMHTESVYIAPWSITAELELFKAAEVGKLRIFVSAPLHKEDCEEMTRDYDAKLAEVFKEAEDRWDKIEQHLVDEHLGMVYKMLPITIYQVASLKKAAIARGSQHLYDRWEALNDKVSYISTFFTKK